MNPKMNNSMLSDADSQGCSVCRELLDNLSRFFEIFESIQKINADGWLTVEDVAKELKVSKSIIYCLIRNGDLEAVNLVSKRGETAQKGHYRIKRENLNQYLNRKRVNPLPQKSQRSYQSRNLPRVKNHLGL